MIETVRHHIMTATQSWNSLPVNPQFDLVNISKKASLKSGY
jgi:hypothetical protein